MIREEADLGRGGYNQSIKVLALALGMDMGIRGIDIRLIFEFDWGFRRVGYNE